jgi:transcriptional regulator with XRE-family HTH domain
MSRKKYTSEDFEFAADFGNKLDDAIDAHDLTRDEAADRLQIHRSMLFRYLGGKSIPGSKVLQRACEELGVTVDYRGIRIDVDYFKDDRVMERPRPSPVQLEFSSIREFLNAPHAQVSIRRKKGAAAERLEIKMTLLLGRREQSDSKR